MLSTVLLIVSIIFALNIGASGIAPSFACVYGSKFIGRDKAVLFFSGFAILGAVILGRNVAVTLGGRLVPQEFITLPVALIIIVSASFSLIIANLLKIPQSTSQVTVGALIGVGAYFNALSLRVLFLRIFAMWIILPLAAFFVSLFLYKIIYPPRAANLYLYQKVFRNEKKLRLFAILVSCYVAFAIGANNIGNVVGPLLGAGLISLNLGLFLFSPALGIGAWLLGSGTMNTAGRQIVPLGLVSGSLISAVTATLLIIASALGIPQSLVQLSIFSTLAVSCLKKGHSCTAGSTTTRKTFLVWMITPMASMFIAYLFLLIGRA